MAKTKAEKKGVVGLGEKLGFMSLSAGANYVFNFKSLYYTIFLTNVLFIPIKWAGIMTTLGLIWDFVNDPLVGVWANNIKFKSGEVIRPYLLWMALPWAAGVVLLFADFNVNWVTAMIINMVVFFFYEIANTFRGIVYNGLGALASSDDEDRKSINGYRSLGGCIGSGLGSVAVVPIVKLFGGLPEKDSIIGKQDAPALFKTALFMGFICILGCLIHYFTSKERVKAQSEDEEKIGIAETYRMLFKCKSWIWNMFYIMGYGVVNALIMSTIAYYAAYVLGASSMATPILAAYLVIAIAFSLLTPALDRKLGRKNTMFFGVLIQILGKIPFIINPYSMFTIYLNAVTTGIGGTITFVMFNTNRNNISDVVGLQNGRRLDTMVSMGDTLASKVAEALVSLAMTGALDAAGFDQALGANQTPETLKTICALIGWVPCIMLAAMLVFIYFIDIEKERSEAIAVLEANEV